MQWHTFGFNEAMIRFHENATVVYTTPEGQDIDTFVVFATDEITGLTHINHEDLLVPADRLTLHSKTACKYHMPLEDSFSFELLSKLKAKYAEVDGKTKTVQFNRKKITADTSVLAKAS